MKCSTYYTVHDLQHITHVGYPQHTVLSIETAHVKIISAAAPQHHFTTSLFAHSFSSIPFSYSELFVIHCNREY